MTPEEKAYIAGIIDGEGSIRQRAQMIPTEYKSLTPRNGRYSQDLLEAKENFYQRFFSL